VRLINYAEDLNKLRGAKLTDEDVDYLVEQLRKLTLEARGAPIEIIEKCGKEVAAVIESSLVEAHETLMKVDTSKKDTKKLLMKKLQRCREPKKKKV
jgi:2-methylaconitate cis-trans-isomerase PrpF